MIIYIKKSGYSLAPDACWELIEFIEKHKGENFQVEVKEVKDPRSCQQNRFFHGALIDAFVRLGDTNRKRIKRILKEKFLAEYDEDGQYVDVKRTRDLSIDEMRVFIDNCINLLADYGGYLEVAEYEEYAGVKNA
jgi:hypothetical protein